MSILEAFPMARTFSNTPFTNGTSDLLSLALSSTPVSGPSTSPVLVLCSLASCVLLCLLSSVLSHALSRTYRHLSPIDRRTWCIGVVRGVFGVVLAALSLQPHLCATLDADVVSGTTPYSEAAMAVLVGFFTFELLSLVWVAVFFGYRNAPLWAHHVLGLAFVGSVMAQRSLHFFALTSCVQELSAPLTSVSWMMAKCGQRKTWKFIANHAALCFVWVFVRIGNDLHRLYYLWRDWDRISSEAATVPLVTFLMGTVLLTFILNPLWLRMKSRQLFRAIRMKIEEEQQVKEDPQAALALEKAAAAAGNKVKAC